MLLISNSKQLQQIETKLTIVLDLHTSYQGQLHTVHDIILYNIEGISLTCMIPFVHPTVHKWKVLICESAF